MEPFVSVCNKGWSFSSRDLEIALQINLKSFHRSFQLFLLNFNNNVVIKSALDTVQVILCVILYTWRHVICLRWVQLAVWVFLSISRCSRRLLKKWIFASLNLYIFRCRLSKHFISRFLSLGSFIGAAKTSFQQLLSEQQIFNYINVLCRC